MKWVYVIAMAVLVVGSCTGRAAETPLMSESLQAATG